MLDLHQFKEVNDRYGHPRGDALLQTAAATLRNSLRTSDYAFRIGGDEFALLLVQSDTEQAITLARRIRANFAAATEPMQMTGAIGLDYGVAVYPNDGDQKEVLVRVADERLYEMKRSQRDCGRLSATRRPPRRAAPPAAPPVPAAKAPPVGEPRAPFDRHGAPQMGARLTDRNTRLRTAWRRFAEDRPRSGLGLRWSILCYGVCRRVGRDFLRRAARADPAPSACEREAPLSGAHGRRVDAHWMRLRYLSSFP